MKHWIQTAGGNCVDLLHPRVEDIVLWDIAEALSRLSRYTGHAAGYTVAQHCVVVCRALSDEGHTSGVQAAGLMHDAHEAYIGDVSSPLKSAMRSLDHLHGRSPFDELDRRHQAVIRSRFGLIALPAVVKAHDLRALRTETRDIMGGEIVPWGIDARPYDLPIRVWSAERARTEFLGEANRLEIR